MQIRQRTVTTQRGSIPPHTLSAGTSARGRRHRRAACQSSSHRGTPRTPTSPRCGHSRSPPAPATGKVGILDRDEGKGVNEHLDRHS